MVNSLQTFNERKQKCLDTIQALSKMTRKVKSLYDRIEDETKNMYPLSIQVFYTLSLKVKKKTIKSSFLELKKRNSVVSGFFSWRIINKKKISVNL